MTWISGLGSDCAIAGAWPNASMQTAAVRNTVVRFIVTLQQLPFLAERLLPMAGTGCPCWAPGADSRIFQDPPGLFDILNQPGHKHAPLLPAGAGSGYVVKALQEADVEAGQPGLGSAAGEQPEQRIRRRSAGLQLCQSDHRGII